MTLIPGLIFAMAGVDRSRATRGRYEIVRMVRPDLSARLVTAPWRGRGYLSVLRVAVFATLLHRRQRGLRSRRILGDGSSA